VSLRSISSPTQAIILLAPPVRQAAKNASQGEKLWHFWVNDREPFLLSSITQFGIRTEEVVKLLLVPEPESSRQLQGIECTKRKGQSFLYQKADGLPLVNRGGSDEPELALS